MRTAGMIEDTVAFDTERYGEEGEACEPPCLRCLALGKKCRSQAGGRASPCAQCHYAHRQSCRPSPPIMLKAKQA
ncbi:hypothetical protein B0T26DRAFT_436193 [Lasiosphaeria miniovina]|uniref:Uncharacterized protein n=1 Tax=Lasiosphaeria miniovina TaxID=1954250 RepID=A0AA40A6R5_9PEZI|nr:uncharacterized protein B0T26DRAFT_436193 [Lasiosphaeria miniovina]KAK0710342.1 hypothetical protein B0T26DRAFT_436193 [Lasiosphaeria miniovina]